MKFRVKNTHTHKLDQCRLYVYILFSVFRLIFSDLIRTSCHYHSEQLCSSTYKLFWSAFGHVFLLWYHLQIISVCKFIFKSSDRYYYYIEECHNIYHHIEFLKNRFVIELWNDQNVYPLFHFKNILIVIINKTFFLLFSYEALLWQRVYLTT